MPSNLPNKVKEPAEVTIMYNQFFYLNIWNYMLLHNIPSCTDTCGKTHTRDSVKKTLKEKYYYNTNEHAF